MSRKLTDAFMYKWWVYVRYEQNKGKEKIKFEILRTCVKSLRKFEIGRKNEGVFQRFIFNFKSMYSTKRSFL